MALVSRSPVRLISAPSSAPHEAMVASLQAHIDELVQKNRTCEHTVKKLQQSLAEEKKRAVDMAHSVKAASQREKEEWKEGCDVLLASHRIVHLRTLIELDKAREEILKKKNDNRKERIEVLHRDFKLTLFQAKVSDLEMKLAEREDTLEEVAEQHEQDAIDYVAQYEEHVENLSTNLKEAETAKEMALTRLESLDSEMTDVKNHLAIAREEHASLLATSHSTTTKLERTTLQLDGVKTALADLESANADFKRANTDLKRQLDKWQTLETKGGAEMEGMRKRRIELEVQVKELQGRVKDLEKGEKESAKAVEKESKRAEKLRKELDRITEVAHDAQDLASDAQKETGGLQEELRDARRTIEMLQALKAKEELANNRDIKKGKKIINNASPNKPVLISSDSEADPAPTSEREVERAVTPKAKPRKREIVAHSSPAAAGEESVAGPSKISSTTPQSSDEEDVEVTPKNNGRGKAKSASKKVGQPEKKTKSVIELSGTEVEDDDAAQSKTKGKARSKKRDEREAPPSHRAASSQPSSKKGKRAQPTRDDSGGDEEEAPSQPKKKKKRLFPPSQPVSFDWGSLQKVGGGLDIPTELSPVKESDAVPQRSVFGKVGSALAFGWH